ncbi:hypothetical protein GJ744_005023 [Endocarpon pusillum]|uniref:Uncharacterized protein n=1 Tax=Endocarpon pusillum TaxID=364733 RepID=A0A8H7DYX5_9EURO|nr:hypothetical protein GJ744_005023 [Endocarpon pusillum]
MPGAQAIPGRLVMIPKYCSARGILNMGNTGVRIPYQYFQHHTVPQLGTLVVRSNRSTSCDSRLGDVMKIRSQADGQLRPTFR